MNVTMQIIERSARAVTVRFLTDRITAPDLNPQMAHGEVLMRPDGLVARCVSDLCIALGGRDESVQLLQRYTPMSVLARAEELKGFVPVPSIESAVLLPEQSIPVS